jgi:hypothetical protein
MPEPGLDQLISFPLHFPLTFSLAQTRFARYHPVEEKWNQGAVASDCAPRVPFHP